MKQYKCLTKDLTRKRKSWVISIHISPPCISWYNILHIQRPIGEDKQPATKKLWRFYMAAPREHPFQSRHRFALHRAVNIHTPAWLNGIFFQFRLKWLTNYVSSFITGETKHSVLGSLGMLKFYTIPGWMIMVSIAGSLMLGGRAATWRW